MENKKSYLAACHCKTVQFEVKLSDGFSSIRRCNCSFCRMLGAVVVSAMISDIRFVAGEDKLTLYQFNTKSAKHYFCSICGIYTHHQRRSKPEEFGFNVACLDNVSPFQFEVVPVLDGLNHPKDGGDFGSAVGLLKFEKI